MTNKTATLSGLQIGFIGAGAMARAIIGGLLKSGLPSTQIQASAKTEETCKDVENTLGIRTDSNHDLAKTCDVLVLAVKPQLLKEVCEEIAPTLRRDQLLISVAAGVTSQAIASWAGNHAIIRCMPNTPCAIGQGASGLFANAAVNSEQKAIADAILSSVGLALFVNEEPLIDSVTAIAGSAPAYFFLFLEAMIDSGKTLGLDEDTAKKLAIQTAAGAAQLALTSEDSLESLRKSVTSPKGTTEQAILSMENNNLRGLVDQAMKACVNRAQQLSRDLSSNS